MGGGRRQPVACIQILEHVDRHSGVSGSLGEGPIEQCVRRARKDALDEAKGELVRGDCAPDVLRRNAGLVEGLRQADAVDIAWTKSILAGRFKDPQAGQPLNSRSGVAATRC